MTISSNVNCGTIISVDCCIGSDDGFAPGVEVGCPEDVGGARYVVLCGGADVI